jgi:SAM-dependent methyltransferase
MPETIRPRELTPIESMRSSFTRQSRTSEEALLAIQGFLDICRDDLICGWAWDSDWPEKRLAVEIQVDGNPLAQVTAEQHREDLKNSGIGDGMYAWEYRPTQPIDLAAGKVSVLVAGTQISLPYSPEVRRISQGEGPIDRRVRLTRLISPAQMGIEIGPYFNPATPKRLGYNCLVLDVFDAPVLRERATADPHIPKDAIGNIEEVDLIGPATSIVTLVVQKHQLGTFDYIISSHNFEHLPNPIRFLQDCEQILRPGGIVSMAIPDRRTCFDFFRPHSILSELLEAYFRCRNRPTPAQLFAQSSLHCRYLRGDQQLVGCSLQDDPVNFTPLETLAEAFAAWTQFEAQPDEVYRDTHCWAFTPASFELLFSDLRFLELTRLEIVEITATIGHEFFVTLMQPVSQDPDSISTGPFYERRRKLLHRINDEAGDNSTRAFAQHIESTQHLQRIAELETQLAHSLNEIAELRAAFQTLRPQRKWTSRWATLRG